MLKNKLSSFLGLLVAFALGILAGFYIFAYLFSHYELSNIVGFEIDPINGLSILANVLLVIYVTRTLTRKNEEERVEKDLLIKRLDNFQTNLGDALTRFFATEKLKFTDVTSELKTLRQDFNSIRLLLEKYEYDNDICTGIDNGLRDVKDYFTDTPKSDGSGNTDVQISQDEISIGTTSRQGIDETNMKIKGQIFDLVVLINRKK